MQKDVLLNSNSLLLISNNKELRDNWNKLLENETTLQTYFVDESGNIFGKFDEESYNKLNDLQKTLYEFSEPYRMTFIMPFGLK